MGMEGVVHCGVVTRATARSETHHDGQGRIWGFGTHRIAASLGACQRKRRARGCATLGGEREREGGGDTIVSQISRSGARGRGSALQFTTHHTTHRSHRVRCHVHVDDASSWALAEQCQLSSQAANNWPIFIVSSRCQCIITIGGQNWEIWNWAGSRHSSLASTGLAQHSCSRNPTYSLVVKLFVESRSNVFHRYER